MFLKAKKYEESTKKIVNTHNLRIIGYMSIPRAKGASVVGKLVGANIMPTRAEQSHRGDTQTFFA